MTVGFVRSSRDAIRVTGRDAVTFLQGLLSQDIAGMAPGEVRRSFLLAPQGKLRALLWVTRTGADDEQVLIVTDSGFGETVASDLLHYRIRVKVDIEPVLGDVWEAWDPAARTAFGLVPGRAATVGSDGIVLGLPVAGLVVGVGIAPPDGWTEVGDAELLAIRVAAGEPAFGVDVDEATIPQETGLVGEAVSFEKGCYLGQELVARIDSRGHVNRHLRRILLTGTDADLAGGDIVAGDAVVGRVTSVIRSGSETMALGLVRREVEPGSRVVVRLGEETVDGEVLERV